MGSVIFDMDGLLIDSPAAEIRIRGTTGLADGSRVGSWQEAFAARQKAAAEAAAKAQANPPAKS